MLCIPSSAWLLIGDILAAIVLRLVRHGTIESDVVDRILLQSCDRLVSCIDIVEVDKAISTLSILFLDDGVAADCDIRNSAVG